MPHLSYLASTNPASTAVDRCASKHASDHELGPVETASYNIGGVEHEIAWSKSCVTWSVEGCVQRYLDFEQDKQEIIQAVLTTFPLHRISEAGPAIPAYGSTSTQDAALVVLFANLVRVYFAHGSSLLVPLSFHADRLLPFDHGLFLRCSVQGATIPQATPALPLVPQNSFYSSQLGQWGDVDSHRHADTPMRDRRKASEPALPYFPFDASDAGSNDLPRWYCLLDPSAEPQLALEAISSSPRALSSGLEFDMIDPGEDFVHLSHRLANTHLDTAKSPTLALSYNHAQGQVSIWQLAITDLDQLASSKTSRGLHRTGPSKRRSSFNPRWSTGSSTPLARSHDYPNTDYGAKRTNTLKGSRKSNARTSASFSFDNQHEESLLEDFQSEYDAPTGRKRDPSRRTSSIVARSELSAQPQTAPAAAASFGAAKHASQSFSYGRDRVSLGRQRFSGRVSTPGSTFLSDVEETPQASQSSRSVLESIAQNSIFATADRLAEEQAADLSFGPRAVLVKVFSVSSSSIGSTSSARSSFSHETQIHEQRRRSSAAGKECELVHLLFPSAQELGLSCINLVMQQETVRRRSDRSVGILSSLLRVEHIRHATMACDVMSGTQNLLAMRFQRQSATEIKIMTDPAVHHRPLCTIVAEDLRKSASQQNRPHAPRNSAGATLAGRARTRHPFSDLSIGSIRSGAHESTIKVQDCHGGDDHVFSINTQPNDIVVKKILAGSDSVLSALRSASADSRPLFRLWNVMFHGQSDCSTYAELKVFTASLLLIVLGPDIEIIHRSSTIDAPVVSELPQSWSWTFDRAMKPLPELQAQTLILEAVELAQQHYSAEKARSHGLLWSLFEGDTQKRTIVGVSLMLCLHYIREEVLLDTAITRSSTQSMAGLAMIIAQFASWTDSTSWSIYTGGNHTDRQAPCYATLQCGPDAAPLFVSMKNVVPQPVSLQAWLETQAHSMDPRARFPCFVETLQSSLGDIGLMLDIEQLRTCDAIYLPRLNLISTCLSDVVEMHTADNKSGTKHQERSRLEELLRAFPVATIPLLRRCLDTFGYGTEPSSAKLLSESTADNDSGRQNLAPYSTRAYRKISHPLKSPTERALKDITSIAKSAGKSRVMPTTANFQKLIKMIYREDQRYEEAAKLLNPLRVAVAEISPKPGKREAEFLEEQKSFAQQVYKRTMALSAGQAIMLLDSQQAPLTEKLTIQSFNTSVNMQPSNNTINVDRSSFTEEKVAWAFFHAGANVGLRLSADTRGIDTSWFVLNKPNDHGNRNAGLLFALGLRGHLKSMARWLAFKYLTAKHNMTSIGLLIGLSASYMGTMDAWMTRMLSVHISRLLPPGAAELNLTASMQAAGVIGIGLLYYSTSHRRMSEVLLSEIEHIGSDNASGQADDFRDESYRLAAGLALGYINLGKGDDLRPLHDLCVPERLSAVATGSRDATMVCHFDQAVAGAVIAIGLIYMKTGNKALAKKLDASLSERHFDHTRPDVLLLRTVAKNLIMWDDIDPTPEWIHRNIPKNIGDTDAQSTLQTHLSKALSSRKIPFYNILAGLCWSIALRFAGSGHVAARNTLLKYFDELYDVCRSTTQMETLSFDASLTRSVLYRVINVLALGLSTVMAGSGDLDILRRLRGLHSELGTSQTFGNHQACHMAIGLLFMGGGRYTLSTSNLALAAMISSFYPIFPTDVLDDQAHLQALRHFWIFAAEPRCVIALNSTNEEPVDVHLRVILRDGTALSRTTPCLLPDLAEIKIIESDSKDFWRSKDRQAAAFQSSRGNREPIVLRLEPKSQTISAETAFERSFYTLEEKSSAAIVEDSSTCLEMISWLDRESGLKEMGLSAIIGMLRGSSSDIDGAGSRIKHGIVTRQHLLDITGIDGILSLRRDVEQGGYDALVRIRTLLTWEALRGREAGPAPWLEQQWLGTLRQTILRSI